MLMPVKYQSKKTSWKNKNRQIRWFITPLYMAALAMLIVIATTWAFEYSEKQRFDQQNRITVLNQLSAIRARLEASISSRLFLMRGLIAYVSVYPNITQAEFTKTAEVALTQQVGIQHLNLVQGTTISHVYPLEGNEAIVGLDLMTIPNLRDAVQRTIKTEETVVAGPIELIDGAQVVFISTPPIFITSSQNTSEKRRYWGFGMLLVNQENLFEEAGLPDSTNRLQYALRGRDGQGITGGSFFGNANIFRHNPVTLSVSLPSGSWRLAAVPIGGWPTSSPISKWLWIGGSMLALMTGILVFTVVNAPMQLQRAINKATIKLRQANEEIQRLEQQRYEQLAEHSRTLEAKVAERTQALSQALENLKATQQELIHSEKMAALGQVIAGVAHEINTPMGAIRSSVENISSFLSQNLEQLPTFFQLLTPIHQRYFLHLLKKIIRQDTTLSSREKRKYRRALVHQLEQHSIEESTVIADTLVEIGIYEEIETFLPLLKDPKGQIILNMAYQFASLQKSTQTITTASERATKVIFALKNFAHYDPSGKKIEANLIEGIETVLTLYYNKFKNNIELVRNYAELPLILCYPDELNQVWINLIHNALQAMNDKGILKIDVIWQDNQVVISITDNGSGISDEVKPKIFEPFFTTKPTGEGSGLGLDIVKKIIDKHEGRIEVESQSGQTTFSVFLQMTQN
ncbi:ATP-binding protein [Candidatus Parabeggiatoa sp. HSG14]|uniref:ATP-binding protein n=1 Tax=Candidatus Parabeggiatoa sp. HSG14 TaxID=3055593 RepID=UPI0032E3F2B8